MLKCSAFRFVDYLCFFSKKKPIGKVWYIATSFVISLSKHACPKCTCKTEDLRQHNMWRKRFIAWINSDLFAISSSYPNL